MSNTSTVFRRKIKNAGDLQSVVRTMKALAAASIGQYENSMRALAHYYQAIELGLSVCLRNSESISDLKTAKVADEKTVNAVIVFGSDQGLVGQFNDVIADFSLKEIEALPGKVLIWTVGERIHAQLEGEGITVAGCFGVPDSVQSIGALVTKIQLESDAVLSNMSQPNLYLYYNHPGTSALYEPVSIRLLPFDSSWQAALTSVNWPTSALPEVIVEPSKTLLALIREYLFISIFRACAESLVSENASRLSAMERADKNIDELLENLRITFNRLRQRSIDEELFDVTAGFEALVDKKKYNQI